MMSSNVATTDIPTEASTLQQVTLQQQLFEKDDMVNQLIGKIDKLTFMVEKMNSTTNTLQQQISEQNQIFKNLTQSVKPAPKALKVIDTKTKSKAEKRNNKNKALQSKTPRLEERNRHELLQCEETTFQESLELDRDNKKIDKHQLAPEITPNHKDSRFTPNLEEMDITDPHSTNRNVGNKQDVAPMES